MKKKIIVVVAILLLMVIALVACEPTFSDAPQGISEDTRVFSKINDKRMVAEAVNYKGYIYKSGDDVMCFRFKEPKSVIVDKKYPLIVFLHGSGDGGMDNSSHMFRSLIESVEKYVGDDCYVFMPQGNKKLDWTQEGGKNANMGMSDIYNACLDQLLSKYDIDEDKVYITGMSMGGNGTIYQAYNYPDKYAAAMPLCGYFPDQVFADYNVLKDIPIWISHSKNDPTVAWDNSVRLYDKLVEVGNTDVNATWIDGNKHDMTKDFYDNAEVWKWLMSKVRD